MPAARERGRREGGRRREGGEGGEGGRRGREEREGGEKGRKGREREGEHTKIEFLKVF